jgi:hypothetical protein
MESDLENDLENGSANAQELESQRGELKSLKTLGTIDRYRKRPCTRYTQVDYIWILLLLVQETTCAAKEVDCAPSL